MLFLVFCKVNDYFHQNNFMHFVKRYPFKVLKIDLFSRLGKDVLVRAGIDTIHIGIDRTHLASSISRQLRMLEKYVPLIHCRELRKTSVYFFGAFIEITFERLFFCLRNSCSYPNRCTTSRISAAISKFIAFAAACMCLESARIYCFFPLA